MSERSTEKKIELRLSYTIFLMKIRLIASRNCYPEMKKYILLNRVGFYRSRIL